MSWNFGSPGKRAAVRSWTVSRLLGSSTLPASVAALFHILRSSPSILLILLVGDHFAHFLQSEVVGPLSLVS